MGKTKNNKILILASTLIVVFFGTAVFVSAQDPRYIGGAGITVFADANFRGTAQTFQYDMADLRSTGLDNRISSIRIGPGEQWEVCEDSNYRGRCIVVSGEEYDLRRNNWSDRISSIRRVSGGGYPENPGYPGNPGGGSAPNWAVGRFSGRHPQGGTIILTVDRNGAVRSEYEGAVSYGTINGSNMYMEGINHRITSVSNGIRIRRNDNGVTVNYFRTDGGGDVNPGVGNPPSWAVGRFYGRHPQDGGVITLTVDRNGAVRSEYEGAVSYGTINGSNMYMEGINHRVTTVSNGIRIRRNDNGVTVNYYRRRPR